MTTDTQAGAAHVVRVDPAYRRVVAAAGPFAPPVATGDAFGALVRAIVFQQLNGRAAETIHGRLLALLGGEATAGAVLAAPPEALRAVGLSAAKAASIVDLARKTSDGTVPLERIEDLGDDEIVSRLVAVRGIGRWTAEMFLLFRLGRLDVWPVDDFAVRKGYAIVHGLEASPKPKALQALGEIYRPYRSVAAWYCWRATDTVLPVA
jgi:3-methyladenine DNA glycosylase/8-oxoguanine DNA glycosylase